MSLTVHVTCTFVFAGFLQILFVKVADITRAIIQYHTVIRKLAAYSLSREKVAGLLKEWDFEYTTWQVFTHTYVETLLVLPLLSIQCPGKSCGPFPILNSQQVDEEFLLGMGTKQSCSESKFWPIFLSYWPSSKTDCFWSSCKLTQNVFVNDHS